MSEFNVVVVEINKIGKHPNADSLSITQIMGGYPCIFRTGDFKPGDKAVYVPVDALVPLTEDRWAFLKDPEHPEKTQHRIKAKKLRGIFSMGVLTPCNNSDWVVGQNVQQFLNIGKWDPEATASINGCCEKDLSGMPTYTDIEGLRKYKNVLVPGEEVVLTEKIHGSNFRSVYRDGRLWVGSHYQVKREEANSAFWQAAKTCDLESRLKIYPDKVFFGEMFGNVSDLKYGADKEHPLFLRFFDIFDISLGKYIDYDDFMNILSELGLLPVPELYRGPWSIDLVPHSEGKSTIYDKHVREGFVVKPVKERYEHCGRVIFKYVGEGYLLRKEK